MIRRLPISEKFSRRFLKGVAIFAVLVVSIATLRSTVLDWEEVPSGSMSPSILPGDRIGENKLAYDFKLPFSTTRLATWGDPRRGDIVVFSSPRNGQLLVKRVVGIPGDVVEADGVKMVLPSGKYFVMGDNRQNSLDSRAFGPVDRGLITGKAVRVLASFDPARHEMPRWDRFMARL